MGRLGQAERSYNDRYVIPVLTSALHVLEWIGAQSNPVRLEDVCRATKFPKTTVYRILQTLLHRGYVLQVNRFYYTRALLRTRVRFGLSVQTGGEVISDRVLQSVRDSALRADIELVEQRNDGSSENVLRCFASLIANQVDLIIQTTHNEELTPAIGELAASACCPLISVEDQHPHGTYFGINYYKSGFDLGQALHGAMTRKGQQIDLIVGFGTSRQRELYQQALSGVFDALRSVDSRFSAKQFIRLAEGSMVKQKAQLCRLVRQACSQARTLVICADSKSILAAAGVAELCRGNGEISIGGFSDSDEVANSIQEECSPVIGCVTRVAEAYGHDLIRLGLNLIEQRFTAPYNFADHSLITQNWEKLEMEAVGAPSPSRR